MQMKNKINITSNNSIVLYKELSTSKNLFATDGIPVNKAQVPIVKMDNSLPEILFISSYPPRECGIATYNYDLVKAIQEKFGRSFSLKVCALESNGTTYKYPDEVKYVLKSSEFDQYAKLADKINSDSNLALVFVQHEFGLFGGEYGVYFLRFLSLINKPVITTFHTVLPNPDKNLKKVVQAIVAKSKCVIIMTTNSATILKRDYEAPIDKVVVIPHGTHKVTSFDQKDEKEKNHLGNRLVLSTFGLMCSTKSIETALDAIPSIIEEFPDVIYLIIGKTHPEVLKHEGEKYRDFLNEKVMQLNLQNHVRFINKYLSLKELLNYLKCTDIYLFTSKDPKQAVSGTFAYAMSCGCPIISTPIPHAKEFMDGAGVIIDFQNSQQLANATIRLLSDSDLMKEMRYNALQIIRSTSWQNSAIAHMELCLKNIKEKYDSFKYETSDNSLSIAKMMTTAKGNIKYPIISVPRV